MNQKVLSKIFIWGFLVLYMLVALISFVHAISFFNIGNNTWMSICLAAAFELGLALSLCSILLSEGNKRNTLPWILMSVLTFVQVIGNVYATFSHIAASDVNYYQNLAKPLLFFLEDVPENTVQVIISWIMGAILPIVALMMTDMIASNIKMNSESEPLTQVPSSDRIISEHDAGESIKLIKPEIVKPEEPKKEEVFKKIEQEKEIEHKPEVKPILNEPPKSKKKFLTKLKDLWNQ